MPMPDTVVVGELGLAKVPVPFTTVQVPMAGVVAVFAAMVTVVMGVQNC